MKPNIIYILADDMGYGDVSCLNEQSRIYTPNLDCLAMEGIRFRDAHSSSAVCTPSRYSILTGRYSWRSWLKKGLGNGYTSRPLIDSTRMTVASLLKGQGYTTACIGKWHLGWTWPKNGDDAKDIDFTKSISDGPTSVGFEYFFGIPASLDMDPYVYIENDRVAAVPDGETPGTIGKGYWRAGPIAPGFNHEQTLSLLTQKAIAFIENQVGKSHPFFLYFPLTAPHTPILPEPQFRGKSGTNEYGDFCLQVDDVVGQIMETLKRHHLSENTIVIFTADNGCSDLADFPELARCGHYPSYVFRGHKSDIYEGGHRIPLIIRWPAVISAGTVSDQTVCLSDFLATCADILGVKLPDNAGEDSVSNLSIWRGERLNTSLREATIHHSIDGSFSIRCGFWKLEMCPGSGGWSYPRSNACYPDSKDAEGLPPIQLYDLRMDIGERKNIHAEHPEIIQKLQDLLTQYVRNGRSTPGAVQVNDSGVTWEQLWWIPGDQRLDIVQP